MLILYIYTISIAIYPIIIKIYRAYSAFIYEGQYKQNSSSENSSGKQNTKKHGSFLNYNMPAVPAAAV